MSRVSASVVCNEDQLNALNSIVQNSQYDKEYVQRAHICKTRPIGTRVIAVDGTPKAGQTARHRLGIIGRRDSVSASFFLLRREAAYHRINRD